MRTLFEMDKKDYSRCNHTYTRNSARSIIIRDGRVAMVHSLKYDYYKFPGGGIEEGENPIDAMIRETREEAGLRVVPELFIGFRKATKMRPNALCRTIIIICAKQQMSRLIRIWTSTRRKNATSWNLRILQQRSGKTAAFRKARITGWGLNVKPGFWSYCRQKDI